MNITRIDDRKFKTIYISYNFFVQVKDMEIFSKYSVLGSLLAKSSRKYKTQRDIDEKLNNMYGTAYEVYVEKYGDLYRFEVRTDFINKKFLPGKTELLDEVLEFMKDMIYDTTDWNDAMIARERERMLQKIYEQKDDKLAYGAQRIEELMAEGEPFGCYLYGTEEGVKTVGDAAVQNSYLELINSPVMVIVSGNLEGYEDIEEKIENVFGKYVQENVEVGKLKVNTNDGSIREFKEIFEEDEVEQAVIALGYKIVNGSKKDFAAVNVLNSIIGVTPSSRLFMNVREKESLCYVIRSKYIQHKNILCICAGINQENYDKALSLIKEQMADLMAGNITEEEFQTAKDTIKFGIKEWKESKYSLVKCVMRAIFLNEDENCGIDELLNDVDALTLEEVKEAATRLNLERVYFLGGKSHE